MSGGKRGSTPPGRRPTFRGGIMQDFVRGVPRVRAWPRKRGKGGTLAQRQNRDKFMNAQRATKYFSPAMYLWFMKQVAGSPLLPRDVMTMMLYNRLYVFDLDDGRELWPMPAIYDVSEALDAIAAVPGQTIVRGPDHWEPVAAPGPSLATKWTTIHDEVISSAKASIAVTNLGSWNELLVKIKDITASTSSFRVIQLSVDNGANYYSGASDYDYIIADGRNFPAAYITLHEAASAAARSGTTHILNNNDGVAKAIQNYNRAGVAIGFDKSTSPINAIRFKNYTGGNVTGGRFTLLGR